VIAGGGSGALLMRALADEHIPFVAGALNIGDSDHTLALRLATDVITEQPYAPISATTLEQVRKNLKQASVLILCPTPFGPGNLPLLREAVHFAQSGRPVISLVRPKTATECADHDTATTNRDDAAMAARDYTGGEATHLMQQLLQAGTLVGESVGEVLEITKKQIGAATGAFPIDISTTVD